MILAQFEREMNMVYDGDLVVQMGDIFDRYVVPLYVIAQAAAAIQAAARQHPGVTYVFIAGNHDLSRDADRVSAFEILDQILWGTKNVTLVLDQPRVFRGYAFLPWSPTQTAEEMVQLLPAPGGQPASYDAAFGHWDIDSFGKDLPNLLPIQALAGYTGTVYTGHVHKPQTFIKAGVDVHVVGSMQPLAHGEEAEPDMYLTMTLEELEANSADLTNKCIRIILAPGEVAPLPGDVGCLQLTVKREGVEETDDIEVDFDDFNFGVMLSEALGPTGIAEKVMARYEQLRGDEHV